MESDITMHPHQKDGPSCPGCGLANYEGMCPHCRGDQAAYEHELVPPFDSSLPDFADSWDETEDRRSMSQIMQDEVDSIDMAEAADYQPPLIDHPDAR